MMQQLFGQSAPSMIKTPFWEDPEKVGWLMKQGQYIKTWRRRWFVLKQGQIFWFKSDIVTPESVPRGVIHVGTCLSIKGAEDVLNKPNSFEITTNEPDRMFFIADTDREKEEWINAIGRAIVRGSRSVLDAEHQDYTSRKQR